VAEPALVLGGGLAGAALACHLARAGRAVRLVERSAGPHDKVCGEFLSAEAVAHLRALGLDPVALGAVPIHRVVLAGRGAARGRDLPFAALSLSRRVLDEALLEAARRAGAEVLRGRAVRALDRAGGGWRARLEGGAVLAARHVFLATGKHDLRGHPRPPGRQDGLLGFKLHLDLAPRQAAGLAGAVELCLFPGGYAGLQAVEGGRANLCLLAEASGFAGWPALLDRMRAQCPHLAARLRGVEAGKPLALARIPYGLVQARAGGLWRLGDQAAVIPSFAGAGMSIALRSAARAAEAFLAGASPEAYQARLAAELAPVVQRATWISRALVHPAGQGLAGRLPPLLLRPVARATRLPQMGFSAA